MCYYICDLGVRTFPKALSAWKSLSLTHPPLPSPNLPVATIPDIGKGVGISCRGTLGGRRVDLVLMSYVGAHALLWKAAPRFFSPLSCLPLGSFPMAPILRSHKALLLCHPFRLWSCKLGTRGLS